MFKKKEKKHKIHKTFEEKKLMVIKLTNTI